MKQDQTKWVAGLVVVSVITALGLWYVSSRQALDLGANAANPATSTAGGIQANITRVSRSKTDVLAIVRGLSGTSQFNSLLISTGVAASIKKSGEKYTIFVPTNGAFAQLPGGTIANFTTAEKVRLVQHHIVVGRAVDVEAEMSGTIQALSGDYLNFSFGANQIPMVNSAITITEYIGKNGVVYLIDNVLLPPKKSGV